jgi:hypothetical protein
MAHADDVKLSAARVNTNVNNAKVLTVHQEELWKGKYWNVKVRIQRKKIEIRLWRVRYLNLLFA